MLLCNAKVVTVSPHGDVSVQKIQLIDFTIEHALRYLNHDTKMPIIARWSATDDIIIEVAQDTTPRKWSTHVFIAVP